MATVTGASEDRVAALEASAIKSAGIDANGHLNLVRQDNTVIDGGSFQAPTGCVQMFAGSIVPAGWLLCNGQALNRTTYAALFAAIGTAYGTGDGVTTFNLPNMEASFPRMQAAARGGTGGAATHQHTVPTHTHAGHAHSLTGGSPQAHAKILIGDSNALWIRRISVASFTNTHQFSATGGNTTVDTNSSSLGAEVGGNTNQAGGSTVNTGGSPVDAGSTLPPYVNLNFIIKA